MKRRVSVIGAGPAGLALAADLERHGTDVLIYSHPDHTRHADNVLNKGCLKVCGVIERSMYPRITFDMGEATDYSKLIILTVPSTGQETILQEMKGVNLRHHTVIAIPGNMFSLIAEANGVQLGCVLETNLSPYSCRLSEDGELSILGAKKLLYIAAHQKSLSPAIIDKVKSVFPTTELKWCSNVVEVCLSNINGVFHPLMMLMNAGRIENTAGDFYLYRDGLTPAVAKAMIAIDDIRIKIGEALGFELLNVTATSNECYDHGFTDLVDLAQNSGPHRNLKAPSNMENRNISEDVPDLLVTWHDLAERLELDASPIKAVVILAGLSNGVDYMRDGRNLKKLHLQELSRIDLIKRFHALEPSPQRKSWKVQQTKIMGKKGYFLYSF